jgi:23S rRNA (cytidine1920-2'-O)/16S rRNA (cytidine1409-2'-O)-methyltransferase
MERTNARYVELLPEPIDLAVIDVSFISLRLILPAVRGWLGGPAGRADVVALVKPQFEAGPEAVGKGGIVRDAAVRRRVLEEVLGWAAANGWVVAGLVRSSLVGAEGNVEYLAWLRKSDDGRQTTDDLAALIALLEKEE